MEPDGATTNQTQTESLSPSPNTVSPVPLSNPTSAPRFGTVIPNRIFVGGIDFKTNENDLRKFFAQYGCVKEVKIVNDRAGVSKGYGFITFETQEDAQKILQEAEKLNYKDKKLNIGPAIRKQQIGIPRSSVMPAAGTMYLTTSTGYPYTFHNGVAYFHTPEAASVPQAWPSRSVSSSPVMVAQPVYQPPTYHYQAPTQCLPSQWQWNVPQSPASSSSFFYLHPSEVIYQPIEITQEGGCIPAPLSLVEAAVPEPYSDHGVQATYHQLYAQSAIAMPAPVIQTEPVKERDPPKGIQPRPARWTWCVNSERVSADGAKNSPRFHMRADVWWFCPQPPGELAMGCGLRKLEDPDDSSPGKIFSTLKRPQVETKTDSAYEYVLLDFTLEASSNPEVIKISSVLDIASKVEEYYNLGYVVGAVHPVILPIGRRRHFPASHMYRVVLSRLKLSPKQAAPRGQRHPRLLIEECPLAPEPLTNEAVKELLEKVNEAGKKGKKFVGFITQHFPQPKACNGTNTDGNAELESTLGRRNREHRRRNSDENYKNWNEGTLSGQSSESGIEEEMQAESGFSQDADVQFGKEGSPFKPRKGDGRGGSFLINANITACGGDPVNLHEDRKALLAAGVQHVRCLVADKLYTVFNVFDDDSTCWTYHEGILSMKVTRKGSVVSTLEADWLELTTFYYKQGLSLIDSFVHWETSKGDHLPRSLEGLFVYEEEGSGVPGSNRKGNDAIVVEQWTVIEGCEIKTDYGPLLHTLAEFGWLLTCVLPTPIVRHDSEGNLATKQVVFLQRPVMWHSAVQTPEKKSLRQVIREEKGKISSRSVGLDTATCHPVEMGQAPDEFHLSPSKQCWIKEESSQFGGFPGFSSSDGVLREIDDGQFDQEDGVTQVTCM